MDVVGLTWEEGGGSSETFDGLCVVGSELGSTTGELADEDAFDIRLIDTVLCRRSSFIVMVCDYLEMIRYGPVFLNISL